MLSLMKETATFPHGAAIYHTGIVFTAVAGVAVLLRIWGNNIRKAGLRWDDALIGMGYIFWLIEQSIGLRGIREGMSADSMADPRYMDFVRLTYIASSFYYPAVTCARIGIVCFYRYIFATPATPNFTRASTILIVFLALFGLATTPTLIMSCVPPATEWDRYVHGRCFNFTNFFIAAASMECVLDFIIICLPLVEVSRLQMSWKRKVVVLLIFLLGGFSLITGILRVALSAASRTDGRIDLLTDILWMQIHNGTLFLCACLPTYRPFVRVGISKLTSLWSSVSGRRRDTSGSLETPETNSREKLPVWDEENAGMSNIVFLTVPTNVKAGS